MKRGETRRKVEMRKSRALSPYLAQSETGKSTDLAEREGFEPPIRLPVCRISSAVRSTTLPPLQALKLWDFSSWPQNEISPSLPNCYHYPCISPPDPLPSAELGRHLRQPRSACLGAHPLHCGCACGPAQSELSSRQSCPCTAFL